MAVGMTAPHRKTIFPLDDAVAGAEVKTHADVMAMEVCVSSRSAARSPSRSALRVGHSHGRDGNLPDADHEQG